MSPYTFLIDRNFRINLYRLKKVKRMYARMCVCVWFSRKYLRHICKIKIITNCISTLLNNYFNIFEDEEEP